MSEWSEPARFEIGLLSSEDWTAKWISTPGPAVSLIRRKFTPDQPIENIRRARLYACGLGYYQVFFNGARLGGRTLTTEYTDYCQRAVYQTYDPASAIKQDENELLFWLAGGWLEKQGYGNRQLIAQLEIEFSDGAIQRIVSNETLNVQISHGSAWETAASSIRYTDIYSGEDDDTSQAAPEWREAWQNTPQLNPQLVGLECLPVQTTEVLEPVKVTEVRPNVCLFDFGQNLAGRCRVQGTFTAGTKLRLRHAELLGEDGSTMDQRTLRGSHSTDSYVVGSSGLIDWEPRFTLHGFRYAELESTAPLPADLVIGAQVMQTPMDQRGQFSCSHPGLTKLYQNCEWTLRSNVSSIFTDCPQRNERQGWMGDGWVSAEATWHHFDAAPFYRKWFEDILLTQGVDGQRWSSTAPPWFPARHQPNEGNCSSSGKQVDAVWTSAATWIPWLSYQHSGDDHFLRKMIPALENYARFIRTTAAFPMVGFNDYGDWLRPTTTRPTPAHETLFMATALFAWELSVLEKAYSILPGDKTTRIPLNELQAWQEEVLTELVKRFYDPVAHSFGSQTLDALALYLELLPSAEAPALLGQLVHDIQVLRDGHLDTGIIGTRFLLEALSRSGRFDVAYQIVTATGYPGWMEHIDNGATTVCERWNYRGSWDMNSHNHPAFASVSAWLFRWLGGLRMDESKPAFASFIIAPELPGDSFESTVTLATPRGKIELRSQRTVNDVNLYLVVPFNTEAMVLMPHSESSALGDLQVNGEALSEPWRESPADRIRVRLGCGSWHLRLNIGASII